MGRQHSRLSALVVQKLKDKGRYADGGGLYLQVTDSNTKSWLFRYMLSKKSREMGLGPLSLVSLAEAREKAVTCRRLLLEGKDPIDERETQRKRLIFDRAKIISFDECAEIFIESKSAEWTNEKHREQWKSTLATYASPIIGKLAVQDVDTRLILKVLEPLWLTKTETGARVRGRIEAVLDWATARGYRAGENPCRWRHNLDKLLPSPNKIKKVEHHAALPIQEMPAFYSELRSKESLSARALELLVLTVIRPGELVGARKEEFDLDANIWTVPASRMKKKIEHRVPLTSRAKQIVLELFEQTEGDFIFPGMFSGHMTTASLLKMVKEMRPGLNLTTHGFRSTFKDWAAEHTNFPNEVSEMALAHRVSSAVERAYRRGDLFLKRLRLMDEWFNYCSIKPSINARKVLSLRDGRVS